MREAVDAVLGRYVVAEHACPLPVTADEMLMILPSRRPIMLSHGVLGDVASRL